MALAGFAVVFIAPSAMAAPGAPLWWIPWWVYLYDRIFYFLGL
jgi:hypothetical protein